MSVCAIRPATVRLPAVRSGAARRFLRRAARGILPAAVAALASGATPGRAYEGGGSPPTFTEQGCEAVRLSPDVASRVRCGTVAVPRDYGHPERGAFRLAVVVIAAAHRPVRPDPDLYISGGPGGPLTVFADAQAHRPLAPDRDLILVDQRGTGASEPALCPDRDRDLVAALATDPAAEARRRAVYESCRDEIVARGIDPADFGTVVTVEDFERVRQALGVERWNVFGVSYGTTVAMTMLALHADTVRSAVLDSVYPPDPLLPPWSVNVADAREAFFASCAGDDACRAAFPGLGAVYRETLQRLSDAPPAIPFPSGMRRPDDRGPLTPSLFAFVVGRLVYYPNFYAGLPRLVAAVHDGETGPFAAALSALFAAESDPVTGSRLSLRAAVECRDRPRFRAASAVPGAVPDMTSLLGICDGWSALGPPPLVPVDTRVPTLVLAGQFDPNARPADSRRLAETIGPHARWIAFAGMGHSVRAFSPCANRIVAAFIDRPDAPVDASCAAEAPKVQFTPRLQAR